MRALVCEGPGTPVLRDVPVPEPGPGEVLVRVGAALTCGTDLKIARRGHPKIPFPLTLGHEWAGVVEKAGAGAAWTPGTRVTSAVSAPCGDCEACRAGRENLCATAFDRPLFGAFADFLLVPARLTRSGLRRIPDGMPDETAALLDPLASVVRGLARAQSARGGNARGGDVLIVGTGPIAALLFFLLRGKEKERTGDGAERRVVVAGKKGKETRILLRKGCEHRAHRTVAARWRRRRSASHIHLQRNLLSLSPSSSVSLVIDTTGDPGVIEALPALASDGGTVLLFAGLPASARVAIDAHAVHYREVSIVGSFHYTPREVDEALALLAGGTIPAEEIVAARRPLAAWAEAFDLARDGTALKVAVIP